MEDLVLDDWQREIIDYDGNVLLCTGRQVGKTLTMSRKAALYMLKHPKTQIIVVSLTEDQAKLIIVMILDYLEKNHKKEISQKKDKPTQNRIRLRNGSGVLARPVGNTGDAVRGFTADVLIIDEASRMPELAFEAARPTLLTTKGKIWMCSTPFGKQGYFYESYLNRQKRFRIWHVSSTEVISNRPISQKWTEDQRKISIEFLNQERKDMTELQFGQEYEGLFLEDLLRFFDDSLISRTCTGRRRIPTPKEDNYMGVDIARMGNDESSFEILNTTHNTIVQIENIVTKKQLTTKTEERIKQLTTAFNCRKVGIDAGSGSLGVGIYDHLKEAMKNKVIAMNNRAISLNRDGKDKQRIFKEDLYDNLKSMMEHGEIILLDDENLITSLRSIQLERPNEKDRVQRVKIWGSYSHIAEGLIRAAWLAKKEKHKKFFISYI